MGNRDFRWFNLVIYWASRCFYLSHCLDIIRRCSFPINQLYGPNGLSNVHHFDFKLGRVLFENNSYTSMSGAFEVVSEALIG